MFDFDIQISELLPPDACAITYPPKPRKMYGRYVPRQLRRYGRQLRASAKPLWLSGWIVNGVLFMHPTTFEEFKKQKEYSIRISGFKL